MIFSWTPPLVFSIATFDDRGVCDFIPSMISGTELTNLLAEPLAGPVAAIYVQKRETYPLYPSRNLWIVDIYIFVTSQFSRCISWLSQFYKSNVFPCFPMFSWWNRCGEKCFQQLRCATMKARSPPSSGGRCFLFFDEMTSLFDDCPLVNRWIVVNSG